MSKSSKPPTKEKAEENRKSAIAALAFAIGFSLLLIGFILIMRTLFAPKAEYDGRNSIEELEYDQESEFYKEQQHVAQPESTSVSNSPDNEEE